VEIYDERTFCQDIQEIMNRLDDDQTVIKIMRNDKQPIVLMSHTTYRSYEETLHLMSSTTNAKRLNDAIHDIEAGHAINQPLMEDE